MSHSPERQLADTLAAIEALDLEPIKFKAMRGEDGYGWSREHADRMAVAYKRYLILHAKYPEETLAPERDVDRFWHLHILDTRKYAADCEATFGHFLHHFPYLGLRGEADERALQEAFDAMQALHRHEFGEPMIASASSPAWCSVERQGAPREAQPAWCSVEKAGVAHPAWCSVEKTLAAQPAWCSVEQPVASERATSPPAASQPAWCSVEKTAVAQPAWCSVERPSAGKAAWCSVESAVSKAANEESRLELH